MGFGASDLKFCDLCGRRMNYAEARLILTKKGRGKYQGWTTEKSWRVFKQLYVAFKVKEISDNIMGVRR